MQRQRAAKPYRVIRTKVRRTLQPNKNAVSTLWVHPCKHVQRSHLVLFPGTAARPLVASALSDSDNDAATAPAVPHAAPSTVAPVTNADNVPLASKKVVTLPKRVNKNARPTNAAAVGASAGAAGDRGQQVSGASTGQGLVANVASAAPDAGRSRQTANAGRSATTPSTGCRPTKQHEAQRKAHENESNSSSDDDLSNSGSDSSDSNVSESGSSGSEYESDAMSSSSDDDHESVLSEDDEVWP